jgi:hypothetical protein
MNSAPFLEQSLDDTIKTKLAQLQTQGLTLDDQDTIDDRFTFLWKESKAISNVSSTKSRQSRARRAYKRIQDASSHLFLAVILVLPPTMIIKREVQAALNKWINLDTYDEFRFKLGVSGKRFLQTTAAERGFAGETLYLAFMQSMFPEQEARREYILHLPGFIDSFVTDIQFAYTLIDRERIKAFLDQMLEGILQSKQWTDEESQGGNFSNCVTIFIPSGEHQDGSCTLRVNRTLLTQTIHEFNMTELRLE